MDRFEGVERAPEFRHQGKRTWDIFHVWQDGSVRDGVRFTSTIYVYPAEPHDDSVKVKVWNPGGSQGAERRLSWGEAFRERVGASGVASVVSLDDRPLVFLWELSAGKEG